LRVRRIKEWFRSDKTTRHWTFDPAIPEPDTGVNSIALLPATFRFVIQPLRIVQSIAAIF
jgi:hypothetical protein